MNEVANILLNLGANYLPGVSGVACCILSVMNDYNQKKAKENLEEFLTHLYNNRAKLEEQFKSDEYNKYKSHYINLIVDFVMKENQTDKVKYFSMVVYYITNTSNIQ